MRTTYLPLASFPRFRDRRNLGEIPDADGPSVGIFGFTTGHAFTFIYQRSRISPSALSLSHFLSLPPSPFHQLLIPTLLNIKKSPELNMYSSSLVPNKQTPVLDASTPELPCVLVSPRRIRGGVYPPARLCRAPTKARDGLRALPVLPGR